MATGSITSTTPKSSKKEGAAPKGNARPSAAPGTDDPSAQKPKERKGKSVRPIYPALVDSEGKATVKLTALPEDYDPKLYRPLKRANFESDALAMKWQAKVLRDKADRLEKQAENLGKLGSRQEQQKVKRLAAMQERMAELRKELEEQGLDVDEVMASMA